MKKKAVIRILCIAIPAVLLIAILGVVWCSFEPQREPQITALTAEDFRNQFQFMQQLMHIFSKKEVPESSVVKLTPEQLNSLLKTGAMFRTKKFSLQTYNLHVAPDGWIHFNYGYDTELRWLHGGVLPLRGRVKLEKENDRLDVSFAALSAGVLPLPESAGQKSWSRVLSRYGNTPEFRFFMECVQSLVFNASEKCFIFTLRTKMLRKIL